MLRRITVVLAGLTAAGFLTTTGVAAAAPADHHHGHRPQYESRHHLTPREREGLRIAAHVLDVLFGGPSRRDHMY
ncbi:hypothetical protein [Streptomyces sp. S186]|uniref:hypothetical protein n=1 Tax=Streptomyces sp. S186 TaxID=3434395 RepID=UPI003F6736D0